MATLSPFIKTIQSSSPSSSSSLLTGQNYQTIKIKTSPSGSLSLLSSDIDEDFGIIDLNSNEYKHIDRNEYWLLNDDEYDPEKNFSYDIVLEWLNNYTPIKTDDEYRKYFHVDNDDRFNSNRHNLTINGYNRFDYLTKSVSRTATITKRKIDNCNNNYNQDHQLNNTPTNSTPSSNGTAARYGTITKGTISRPFFQNNNREINRTFDLNETRFEFSDSPSTISTAATVATSSDDNDTKSETPKMNDRHPINTNTITKTNRRILNVSLDITGRNLKKSLECDTSETETDTDFNPANNLTTTTTSDDAIEEFGLSSDGGLNENNDLQQKSINPSTRKFDKNIEESNDGFSSSNDDGTQINNEGHSQSSDMSGRNYPTISRNTTRTILLRREASQGQILNNNKINNQTISRTPQPLKQVYLVSSNDDLLSSDCSTLSMRSSMSGGRSEPNLLDVQKRTVNGATTSQLSIHNVSRNQQPKPRLSQIQITQSPANKFQSRLMGPTAIAMPSANGPQRISRIARPTTNGAISSQPSLVNIRNSGIPGNNTSVISNNSYGSMGSIRDQQLLQRQQQQSNQYQMPRPVSQIKHPSLWKQQQQHHQPQQQQQGSIPTAKFLNNNQQYRQTSMMNAKSKAQHQQQQQLRYGNNKISGDHR